MVKVKTMAAKFESGTLHNAEHARVNQTESDRGLAENPSRRTQPGVFNSFQQDADRRLAERLQREMELEARRSIQMEKADLALARQLEASLRFS